MKTETAIFIVIVVSGLFILAIWLWDIPVVHNSAPIITFLGGSLIVILILYWLFMMRQPKRGAGFLDSFDAFQYLQERWYEARKEKLKFEDTKAIPGWFEDKLFYAFRFRKSTGETGQTVIAIVQSEPKDVFWEEDPAPDEIRNPFEILKTEYKHAPIKNARPVFETTEAQEKPGQQQVVYVGKQEDDEINKFRKKEEPSNKE